MGGPDRGTPSSSEKRRVSSLFPSGGESPQATYRRQEEPGTPRVPRAPSACNRHLNADSEEEQERRARRQVPGGLGMRVGATVFLKRV